MKKLFSKEEQACKEHFTTSVRRDETGRYEVLLPFKGNPYELGESFAAAFGRLQSLEQRFRKDKKLHASYVQFMRDYEAAGHMFMVKSNPIGPITGNLLPHYGVCKVSQGHAKLRVVFDASCATGSGRSLNDLLMVGPTIQQDLNILARFRQHPYVLTADISQMYRQIRLRAADRRWQRILWREDPGEPVQIYELNTVTYGTASAPFLAVRCLHHLAKENQLIYLAAAIILKRDFYVDDMLTGAATVAELRQLRDEVTSVLLSAGMDLHKWQSNVPGIITPTIGPSGLLATEEAKTLGITWDPARDEFVYQTSLAKDEIISKRRILSIVTQIYDPLGLVNPITLWGKIIMQTLWKLKVDWDGQLPDHILRQWNQCRNQLIDMPKICILRCLLGASCGQMELHGFCDASQMAYEAAIYVCHVDLEGNRHVGLLCSKSRIAPPKAISIPRLELCGAVLLTNLMYKMIQLWTIQFYKIVYWTDSTIVLHWINKDSTHWKVFVGNRVSEIQYLSERRRWRHVDTSSNPADLITKGIDPGDIASSNLWWTGPEWLKQLADRWPSHLVLSEEVSDQERVYPVMLATTAARDLIYRFSTLTRVRRVVAFCLRFAGNARLRTRDERRVGALTVEECDRAVGALVRVVQRQAFSGELHRLRNRRQLSSGSPILSLNSFLDGEGVLRVGGRLHNSTLPYDARFPILLPKSHHFTTLIIRDAHYRNLHVGAHTLVSILREKYWIVSAASVVRGVLRKCILCFRKAPIALGQLMGNLPANKVTPSRPFTRVGMDYAGPFQIKISRNKTGKAYLAIFVCMSTKALHLEVVSDLSTSCFLNALKRFISRRGKSECIWSDNGRNFLGAKNELDELGRFLENRGTQAEVQEFATEQSIEWKFIPPYSPHIGGIWEAAVKSAKNLFKAVVNRTSLSFEELTTCFVQVEAILNSWPLSPVSSDPRDLTALIPGHFLIGTSIVALSERDVTSLPVNLLNRYQLLTQLVQSFWTRWSRDYLAQLQFRTKWKRTRCNPQLKPGVLVLIRDDSAPPTQWRLDRIKELIRGRDNLTRIVTLRTQLGETKRTLSKICILPIDE